MGMHLIAYGNAALAGAYAAELPAIQDPSVFTEGNLVRIPDNYNRLLWVQLGGVATVGTTRAELQSPSLTAVGGFDLVGAAGAATPAWADRSNQRLSSPFPLAVSEGLELYVEGTAGAGPDTLVGLVALTDGALAPVAGDILTVRATYTALAGGLAWQNRNITFTRPLPVGRYQVVGMQVWSATATCARLVFVDSQRRPGVAAYPAGSPVDPWLTRGAAGVWGEFHTTAQPTLDLIDIAGGAGQVFLDLMRVG